MMPYRGEVLSVEDSAGIVVDAAASGEVTMLICTGRHSARRGVLVSRVLEVTTSASKATDVQGVLPEIALLKDRITVIRGQEQDSTVAGGNWSHVA